MSETESSTVPSTQSTDRYNFISYLYHYLIDHSDYAPSTHKHTLEPQSVQLNEYRPVTVSHNNHIDLV